jgi:fatty acid desaturase
MSVAELPPPTVNEAAFIRQAKQICQDLMPHRAAIYWADFLIAISLAWGSLFVCLYAEPFSVLQIGAFVVCGLMLYRSSVFTHELAHLPPSRFRLFRVVWNLLFGCPFLMPTFLYTDHRVHHTNQTYGTDGDGEYYPYANTSVRTLILNFLITLVVPLLPVIRFGILAPVSMLHPKLRKWVWSKASSLGTLNPAYRRAAPDADERRTVPWQEAGCVAVVATVVTLLATGVMAWTTIATVYGAYLLAVTVNNLRVYAGHRYVGTGQPMSFLDQMLDSTTIPGPLGAIWAPLGMRFHALHHLFPAMPYHAMGAAHRRLMRQLPPDSPYHQTLVPNLAAALAALFRAARAAGQRDLTPVGK